MGHTMRIPIILSHFMAILLAFAVNAYALDNLYLLKKGKSAQSEGEIEKAIEHYREYIEFHPTTKGANSPQYKRKEQYYIRNLLIAYSTLFEIYRQKGKDEEIDALAQKLKETHKKSNFLPKNLYNLATIFLDNKSTEEATILLHQILKEHQKNYSPRNNKAALRAYAKLFSLYGQQGEEEKKSELAESLISSLPTHDFDLKDSNKFASLCLQYGSKEKGEEMLKEIINKEDIGPESSSLNAIINTYSKLLQIYHEKNDKEAAAQLMKRFSKNFREDDLSPENLYKLAITYLDCGEEKESTRLLRKISEQFPYSITGRKSLFLLGRISQSKQDWDAAIQYFGDYVAKYPHQTFFALKAYSRLLDSYWARGSDLNFLEDEINELANIVNDISDFEVQLNLARDLKWKGMDELAAATFSLGVSSARKCIAETEDTYKKLRAYWLIEKYAYAVDRFDLVEECGNLIMEICSSTNDASFSRDTEEKIQYFKNQSYLWLAKVYRKKENYPESAKFLKAFIKTYPNHEEINYARYELGQVYEEADQKDVAAQIYITVGESMWKKKAQKRLSILGY